MIGTTFFQRFALYPAVFLAVLASGIGDVCAQDPTAVANAPAAKKIVKQIQVVFKGGATIDEARVRSIMATREG